MLVNTFAFVLFLTLSLALETTAKFVSFGAFSGDVDSLSDNDTASELLIESRTGFRIGDYSYKAVYIGSYGIVSFGSPVTPCCSEWNPGVSVNPTPFIAPLWTRGEEGPWSHVYFRHTLEGADLEDVQNEVLQGYGLQRFTPKLSLVVTWVGLPCCSIDDMGVESNNTFQLVLVSDHFSTYVLVKYEQDTAFFDPSNAKLAGISWWAGVNFGDGRYFTFPAQPSASSSLSANDTTTTRVFKLTRNPLEVNNRGREFYFAFSKAENQIPNLAISIAPVSKETVTVEVSGANSVFSRTVKVSNGFGEVVTVSDLYTEELMLASSFKSNGGVRVRVIGGSRDAVVSVSVVSDVQYQSSGFLVPSVDGANFLQFSSSLLKYCAVMYSYEGDNFAYMIIVAQHDGTVIEITPTQPVRIGNRQITNPGSMKTLSLNRDETLIIQSSSDLTGSTVTTWGGKPISFYCGHTSTEIPAGIQHSDFIGEYIPPVNQWGLCYVTAPLLPRSGYELYRIVAAFDDTKVNISCWSSDSNRNPVDVEIALNDGEFWDSGTTLGRNATTTISSFHYCKVCANKPVLVSQFSVGAFSDYSQKGNPSMIVLPSTDSYGSIITVSPGYDNWNVFTDYVALFLPKADYQPELIRVGDSPLSRVEHDIMGIPPESPEYYAVRLEVFNDLTISHTNPMARMGGVVYGVAKFTGYGYTASISKEQDMIVLTGDGHVVPNNGYSASQPPTTLSCHIDPNVYESGTVMWMSPSGEAVPTGVAGEFVYQERSEMQALLHIQTNESKFEGYYFCQASFEGIVKQLRVGVFVTPPAPSEVSSLSASAVNSTAILLQWTPPTLPYQADIVSYTVVFLDNTTTTYSSVDVLGNMTSHVIGHLKPNTEHVVGVYATSMTGAGPASLAPPLMTHRITQEVQRCPNLKMSSDELNTEIASSSRYIPVVLGSTVKVTCKCEISVSTSVPVWYFGGTRIGTDSSSLIHQTMDSRLATLIIKVFSLDHTGAYACRDFNTLSEFFLLPVDSTTGTELPFVLSPPTSYRMELGTSVSLSCAVRGEGLVGVHWETKSGKKYPTELPGKPFLLEHVGPDAQDEYRCVVHSAKGEVVSSYARVAVYGTPILLTNGKDIVVDEGKSLLLTCLVSVEQRAVHTPKLVWFQNGNEVYQDEYHKLVHNVIQGFETKESKNDSIVHEFKLAFSNLTRNDLGVFECRLFHRIGGSHRHAAFNVSVQYKPQDLKLSHNGSVAISRFSQSHLSLKCSVFANPAPTMLWVREGVAVVVRTALAINWDINPQDPKANGKYTCLASNKLGVVEDGFHVEVKNVVLSYKGVAYENNSIVSIGADYPANISCSLEGIDSTEANVTWYYPNGLPVGGALGHSIFQTNTSSSELKWVESVLTWQPTRMYDGSFNGEGFYQCHVTTTHGLEESVHLGMFLRPPVPGPPQAVSVERVVPYSLKVTWTNPISYPSNLISRYTIRHYKIDRSGYSQVQVVTFTADGPLEYTFESVELGADHTVGVAAVSEGGLGAMSVAKSIKIPREAFRGKQCKALSTKIYLPRGQAQGTTQARVSLGSEVVIFCSCLGADFLTITDPEWTFNEDTLPDANSNRRGFFILPLTQIAVLRITAFSLDDVGGYVCSDYHLRTTITLSLGDIGDDGDIPTGAFLLPQLVVALPGHTVQLPCVVEGKSLGNLTWKAADDRSIPPANPSNLLFFGTFQRNNAGQYLCQQESRYGVRTSHGVGIQTYGLPNLVGGGTTTDYEIGEGKSILLQCVVHNDPLSLDNVRFEWYKNGRRIVPDNRKIRIVNTGENKERTAQSTLQVIYAEDRDEGVYRCTVRNLMGSSSRNTTVTVHPGPSNIKVTPPGPLTVVLSGSFNITCSAVGDPTPEIQWKKNNVVISTGSGTATYSVSNTVKGDDAIYYCSAENKFGRLDKALRVQVVDVCESRGLRCRDACRQVYGEWQCVCRAGAVLVNRRTECQNCGHIPFRQPQENFDRATVPGIEEIPENIFRLNYYTHPWTVALCDTERNKMFCGGVLVNNEWVLTLGSCVCKHSDFRTIRAVFIDPFTAAQIARGVVGTSSNCLNYPVLSSQALQIVCHSSDKGNVQEDSIALVRIQKVPSTVSPICLPSQQDTSTLPIQAQTTQFFPEFIGGLVRLSKVSYKLEAAECSKAFSPSGQLMCIGATRAPCNRVGGTAIISSSGDHHVVTGLFNGHSSECVRHVPYEKHISVFPYLGWIRNTTSLHTYRL